MLKNMLTVRLTSSEEQELNRYCQKEGLPKSQVVKEALALYLKKNQNAISPYEAGEDLFGIEGSGIKDKSITYKKRLKQILNEKHAY
ncbi:transcriptional regulator [Marivirga lumbricoides]|uniref:Transcriptional regulator n=2 Tax=Marivirga lumbricoides TaxID=1046115 RepID=A0ABQ1MNN8_9BACT|nr:transcriptional regulator [Marivirga lumbricoides]